MKNLSHIDKIIGLIKNCEIDFDKKGIKYLGFKISPSSSQEVPDTWSTSYALVILKLLDKLEEYLKGNYRENKKTKIRNFILSCRNKNQFLHCTKNCKICKKTSEYRTLFSVLEALLVLDGSSMPYEAEILPLISNSKKTRSDSPKYLFKLLDLKYFGAYNDVSEEKLKFFQIFQRKNGGFNFSTPVGSIKETFWIVYMFENYKYLSNYERGNLYSFIVQNLKKVDPVRDTKNSLKMMGYAKLVILLSFVWKNLIDELENLIFTTLTAHPIMGLNDLTLKGGVKDAEYEIIAFINLKYNLTLNILDNATRFNQFQGRLTSIERYFAKHIYRMTKRYVRIDLTEILDAYNKGKIKSARVQHDLILKLVNQMINERFFKGKIIKRKRLFRRNIYSLNREQFIAEIISCDKIINFDDITREKRNVENFKEDIFNMTREMKNSSTNIMNEVESLIFVDEIEYAEKRLKTNIKKALMEAEFFNENVRFFVENLEYIKGEEALKEQIKSWRTVYNGLQSDFNDVNLIMMEKIKDSEKLQHQKNLLYELESLVSENTADLVLSFDMFQEAMRKRLDKNYSDDNVRKLRKELDALIKKIENLDDSVVELSQSIIVDDFKVKNKRKKIINSWISKKENFEEVFTFYHNGFKTQKQELEKIEEFYKNIIEKIDLLKKQINDFVVNREFIKAFKIIDEDLGRIFKIMDKETENFQKRIKNLMKKRKLFLLFVNLEKEWKLRRKQLEDKTKNIREELRNKIEIDKKSDLKEDYIKLVNEKIDFLDDSFTNLNDYMDKTLNEGNIPNYEIIENIEEKISHLKNQLGNSNQLIGEQLKKCEKNITNFGADTEDFIAKWNKFRSNFEQRTVDLKESILDDTIIKVLKKIPPKINSNKIDITIIAEEIKIDKDLALERVGHLLNISKISGDLISGTEHTYLILHEKEWRINKRLRLFMDGEVNEIKIIARRINQLYNSSLKNSTFTINVEKFKELVEKFNEKVESSKITVERKINELKPDNNNNMFLENKEYFQNELKQLRENAENILLKTDKAVQISDYISKQLTSIGDVINLRMYKLNEIAEEKNKNIHEKNKVWLKHEIEKLNSEIDEFKKQVKDHMEKMWSNVPDSSKIMSELEKKYILKLNDILNSYEETQEELEQKLINFEYIRVRKELEKILTTKQDILNKNLGKIQYDVENKIEIKEFKSAMQKLRSKLEKTQELIKKADKELKKNRKKITAKSKIFSVENKYLLDQWESFLHEYREIVKEKKGKLQLKIIEEYIKMTIGVFKDEYIPFKYLTKEFNLKKNVIKDRIIALIGEGRLSGKIYLELEIYYENNETIEKLDKSSVELIKSSNVQTYLLINKLRRIAKQYYPLLMLIGSVLTIILSLGRIIIEQIIPWWVIPLIIAIIVILFLIAIWLNKGKEKINIINKDS
ncbi:MAG: hypothetical protein ACTSWY_16265 [Promethearchaeota archaeon]